MRRFNQIFGGFLLICTINGCSVFQTNNESLPEYQVDYKKSAELPSLELPPGLTSATTEDQLEVPMASTAPSAVTSSEYNQSASATLPGTQQPPVLPSVAQVQLKRQGETRWLVLATPPETVWPKVKNFWLENGFTLKIEEPKIGIMETEWAENRAAIPQDGLRKVIGKVFDNLYSASTRDKFRVRLEPGEQAGTTELYLTHKGTEEVSQGEQFVWQNRPSDPELEAEMLNRLLVDLGTDKQKVDELLATAKKGQSSESAPSTTNETAPRANLTLSAGGKMDLLVQEGFASVWQRTGLALDRIGFTVEDRDRERGVYFIRYLDPETDQHSGFLTRIFGSSETAANNTEYFIKVKDETPLTRITVLDKNSQEDSSKTAHKILTLLQEQLK